MRCIDSLHGASPTKKPMHKKILLACVSGLALALSGAFAQTPAGQTPPATPTPAVPAAPSWSVTATPSVVSQYMFRGVRLGGASFEPTVEADYGNLALLVWANFPIKNKVPG